MSSQRRHRLFWLLLVSLLAVLVWSSLVAPLPDSPLASIHNPGPQGLMALSLLLRQAPQIELLEKRDPQQQDPAPTETTLVICEPARQVFSDDEADEILAWVHRGGRLVLLYNANEGSAAIGLRAFSDKLDIQVMDVFPSAPDLPEARGLLQDIHTLSDEIASVFIDYPDDVLPLITVSRAQDQDGLSETRCTPALLLLKPWGQGQVYALSQLQLVDNAHLGQADHARLAAQLLAPQGQQQIIFDESHHRPVLSTATAWWDHPALRFFAAALALCALFWALAHSRRGGLRPIPPSAPLAAAANVRALARLYRNSGDLDGLNARLKKLAQDQHLPWDLPPARNLRQWQTQMRTLLQLLDRAP